MDDQKAHDDVDRIDFQILGVANQERKLARVLDQQLVPLLNAAQSPDVAVRKKVSDAASSLGLWRPTNCLDRSSRYVLV